MIVAIAPLNPVEAMSARTKIRVEQRGKLELEIPKMHKLLRPGWSIGFSQAEGAVSLAKTTDSLEELMDRFLQYWQYLKDHVDARNQFQYEFVIVLALLQLADYTIAEVSTRYFF